MRNKLTNTLYKISLVEDNYILTLCLYKYLIYSAHSKNIIDKLVKFLSIIIVGVIRQVKKQIRPIGN